MPGNNKKTVGFRAVLASAGLALLLAACGTGADSDATLENPPARETPLVEEVVAGQPLAPAVIGIVKLAAGQTIEDAAKAYDGRPIRDRRGSSRALSIASTDGTSIEFLAFDSMPPLRSQMVDSESEFDIVFEENQDRFTTSAGLIEVYGTGLEALGRSTIWAEGTGKLWAEGRSTIWAEGRSTIWAEGRSSLWAEGRSSLWAEGGDFIWMPENSPVWNRLNLRDAHSEARQLGRDVVVAVIDTGIDITHPAFEGAISEDGWNFVENNDDPSEVELEGSNWSFGHGTVVADIVRQIAPGATILPIRALEADGSGDVFNVVRAVYYAVHHGAQIINMSLGGPEESPALTEAIRYANERGVFVTISAGNNNKDSLNYPSAIAGDTDLNYVISVTSVDSDDVKSQFSNWGVGAEIAAFGEGIVGPYPDYGLAQWSGTSMAAPQVAGALALALGQGRSEWEEHPREWAGIMFEEGVSLYSGRGPKNQNRQYRNLDDGTSIPYPLGRSRLDIEEFIDEAIDD